MEAVTQILSADIAADISPLSFLIILATTILCGLIFSTMYIYNHKDKPITDGLALAIVIVPIAAAIVILLVGRNIATALGLGGIFVLVRFRSGPVEVNDLSYLFAAICNGVLCGCGYVAYDIIFTAVMCAVIYLLERMNWGQPAGNPMLLKIWVPETLDFQGVFEPVLDEYCDSHTLLMVRTTDFGSLCELRYRVLPKDNFNQKEFLDNIRTKNGNMNVVLVIAPAIVGKNSKQVL